MSIPAGLGTGKATPGGDDDDDEEDDAQGNGGVQSLSRSSARFHGALTVVVIIVRKRKRKKIFLSSMKVLRGSFLSLEVCRFRFTLVLLVPADPNLYVYLTAVIIFSKKKENLHVPTGYGHIPAP